MPRPIVVLHLPKPGGQTIPHAIGHPISAPTACRPRSRATPLFPPDYRLHSGHLDSTDLDRVAGNPFSFMVLRDPRERFAMMDRARFR